MVILTTQVYVECDGEYLMLHRTKKENDLNEGKYIAPGGHFEPGETPEECAKRELREETGLDVSDVTLRGIVRFISPQEEEEMYIYTSTVTAQTATVATERQGGNTAGGDGSHPALTDCDEGDLEWIPKDKIMDLDLWEGDRKFLKLMRDGSDFFRMTLRYDADGDLVIRYATDGEEGAQNAAGAQKSEDGNIITQKVSDGSVYSEDVPGRILRDPILIQTENALDQIGWYLDSSVHKALIVTGKHSAKSCGALDDLDRELRQKLDVEYTVFDQVEENPSVETVMAAAKAGIEFGADVVIGIGGGSPMDAAKAAALLIKNPDKGIDYLYEKGNPNDYVPVICIATTCGTGSEATGVSVLSRPAIGEKGSIPYRIWPEIGLMDPKYLKKAPISVIRNTAIDALAHLCESFISSKADDVSRACVMQGLSIWKKAKDSLLSGKPDDADLKNLLTASTLGGMAIATTSTSLPHALSYPLTVKLGFAHGVAVGYFLAGYLREAGSDGMKVLNAAGYSDADELNEYYLKVCDPSDVPADLIEHTIEKTIGNPDKMALCPYQADKETLHRMPSRR